MGKSWSTFEHPADLGLSAEADSLAALLEALGEGMSRQICDGRGVSPKRSVAVEVVADDPESLAVDFLSELLKLFHLERFLVADVRVDACDETSASATATGETYDPDRHELGAEIKAVTYHQIKIAREGEKWVGRVILDV
ncbi:MAG TPA: archease [Phycisphaerae bacterium]|nr:archease [Phycisphaerae bacterium]